MGTKLEIPIPLWNNRSREQLLGMEGDKSIRNILGWSRIPAPHPQLSGAGENQDKAMGKTRKSRGEKQEKAMRKLGKSCGENREKAIGKSGKKPWGKAGKSQTILKDQQQRTKKSRS